MDLSAGRITRFFLFVIILLFLGCASVPKEVVELSYTVGQDLNAVHSSYRELIRTRFDDLRTQTVTFLETRWIPNFLKDFIQRGELIQSVKGSDPKVVLEDVGVWVEVAIEMIETKKRELLDPIDNDEQALLRSVDEAFFRLTRANAVITAHLNSLRKVQEVQDDALKALKLKELRDKINQGLISASDKAREALEKLKKAEGLIDKAEEKRNNLQKKLKGDANNE